MAEASMPIQRFDKADSNADLAAHVDANILSFDAGIAAFEGVASSGNCGFSCSLHWVRHWAEHVNPNIAIVTATRSGQPILAIALEIVNKSGLTAAQFVGGSHANANFPAMTAALSQHEAELFLAALVKGLKEKPWSVDIIMLERQLGQLGGIQNPLLANGGSISPNVSLHLDVDQNFDAVLAARSGKRKRKRYRSQQRKFEAAGGFNIINPNEKEDVELILDSYFVMKAQQLNGKGVANVFGNSREQLFFKALFSDKGPLNDHKFYLSSLEVGGKTRAIYGSSLHALRQMVHFTAFAEDELAIASPGDFLNFALIEAACKGSIKTYDLGVGDEGYKRSWCDVETWHHDVIIGISLRGKLAKLQFSAIGSAKRWIKNNEKLWSVAKRVRKFKAGRNKDQQIPANSDDGSEL
jgi:CelD/BcsL family acetyltransferase involved in cellulose biosynthesis